MHKRSGNRILPVLVTAFVFLISFSALPASAGTKFKYTATIGTAAVKSGFATAETCATGAAADHVSEFTCAYDAVTKSFKYTGKTITTVTKDGFGGPEGCAAAMQAVVGLQSGTCISYTDGSRCLGTCESACTAGGSQAELGTCTTAADGAASNGMKCCIAANSVGGACSVAGKNGACKATCATTEPSGGTCNVGSGTAYDGMKCCVPNTAAGDVEGSGAGGTTAAVSFTNPLAFDTVQGATAVFLAAFQGIIVMLALIFLVLGGILYITSAGDTKNIDKAKAMITAAMIGLAIGVAAPSLLKTVGDVLGWGGAELPTAVTGAKSAMEVAQGILDFLLSITGLLAMLMLVIGGLMFFAAAGDEKRAETAKSIVKYAVMGVALAITSLIIVRTVATLFTGS